MTDAKLSKLVKFYGQKLDVLAKVDTEFARGSYIAYSIAKQMTQEIIYELLDRALSED